MKAGLIAVILAMLVCSAPGQAAPARPVTVGALIKSPPRKFQPIRVVGQVDNCRSLTCYLCPEDMTNETFSGEKCLGLSFEGFPDGRGDGSASGLMDEAFRFATVVLDAWYDPTCISKEVTCTDRLSVITGARVIEVRSRKSALDGIVSSSDVGPLTEPSADDRIAMMREISTQWSYIAGPERKVFQLKNADFFLREGASAGGLGCICLDNSCEGRWPTRYFFGFESPANPFKCLLMEKGANGWRVVAQ